MDIQLVNYVDTEHLAYIEKWERKGEIFSFLSHSRPRYLREKDVGTRDNTIFYMIVYENDYIGAAWLEDITNTDAKLGIYIAAESLRGKGIGEKVIKLLIRTGFNELGLKKIYLNVRERNTRAINCYKKCGFIITRKYDKRLFCDGTYQRAYEMTLYNSSV